MRRSGFVLLLASGLLAVGCGGSKTVTETVTVGAKTRAGPPSELAQFGYIRSLKRDGGDYRLKFDPAWFLSGETANAAAAEDGAVEPGQPVPNDNYTVDEGHRQLTYLVPSTARVTVLADGPSGTPITVAELAELVAGKNPLDAPLFEPISTGFWLQIEGDTVSSLDQQYRP
jgi:hypothetical protein